MGLTGKLGSLRRGGNSSRNGTEKRLDQLIELTEEILRRQRKFENLVTAWVAEDVPGRLAIAEQRQATLFRYMGIDEEGFFTDSHSK